MRRTTIDTDRRETASRGDTATSATLAGDERGLSEVLGAIMLFGLLMAVLALIQLTAVPGWNQAIEFDHNKRVQEDLRDFDATVSRVSSTDIDVTTTVELGTRYPSRPFLFNPPPANGRLTTTDGGNFAIENVDIAGVDTYWNATDPDPNVIEGATRGLVYEPQYRQYRRAPRTIYEHGTLANRFQEKTVLLSETHLVEDNRITLTTIRGNLSTTQVRAYSLDVSPLSAPRQPVSVTNATTDPIQIRVPTQFSEARWEEILTSEYVTNGGHVLGDADGVTVTDGVLTVTLEPGVSYDLRLASVAVSAGPDPTSVRYLTATSERVRALQPNEPTRLTVEARDEFNNPKSGTQLTFTATNGTLSQEQVRTDDQGRAQVRYTAPSQEGTETITASVDRTGDGDTTDAGETETFTMLVRTPNASEQEGNIARVNPGPNSGRVMLQSVTGTGDGANLTFDNEGATELTMARARISYYFTDDTTSPPPSSATFEFGGSNRTLTIPDQFVEVDGPTFAAEGTSGEQQTVEFTDIKNNVKGDFFFLSVVYTDPTGSTVTSTYVVGISD